MPQPQPDWPKTLDEFRAWHERQPEVWEFIDGVPVLMAPGSKTHTLLKSNLGRLLGNALEGTGCTVLVDGAIVEARGSSLIPDIVVTCQPLDLATPRVDEPMIIVEVLSPSGEKDDLGRKLALYLEVPSLRHYLVIHQEARRVVHHQRRDELGRQFLTTIVAGEVLRLEPPGIDLPLARLYDGVPVA
jgi:Uma2 family endonuclease